MTGGSGARNVGREGEVVRDDLTKGLVAGGAEVGAVIGVEGLDALEDTREGVSVLEVLEGGLSLIALLTKL